MICFQLDIDTEWLKYAKINYLIKISPLVNEPAITNGKGWRGPKWTLDSSNTWPLAGDALAHLQDIGTCKWNCVSASLNVYCTVFSNPILISYQHFTCARLGRPLCSLTETLSVTPKSCLCPIWRIQSNMWWAAYKLFQPWYLSWRNYYYSYYNCFTLSS